MSKFNWHIFFVLAPKLHRQLSKSDYVGRFFWKNFRVSVKKSYLNLEIQSEFGD